MSCTRCTNTTVKVLASYPGGDPRSGIRADRAAADHRDAHPDVHVHYDLVTDAFVVAIPDAALEHH